MTTELITRQTQITDFNSLGLSLPLLKAIKEQILQNKKKTKE